MFGLAIAQNKTNSIERHRIRFRIACELVACELVACEFVVCESSFVVRRL